MRTSHVLVLIFIASFGISGIIEGYFGWEGESTLALTHALVIAVISFAWCKADSSELDISPPAGSAIFCGVLPPIGVPVHLFRTRRLGVALLGTAIAIAVLVISVVAYSLMLYAGKRLGS